MRSKLVVFEEFFQFLGFGILLSTKKKNQKEVTQSLLRKNLFYDCFHVKRWFKNVKLLVGLKRVGEM